MKSLFVEIKRACIITAIIAVVTCAVYPLVVWGLAHVLFPDKAEGSLIISGGKTIASELIAQPFEGENYFHPRPSAVKYNPSASGGSNLGPLSKKLIDSIGERASLYRKENALAPDSPIPVDAVTASGSGLDPHISVENALLQAKRVARARGLTELFVREMITAHIEGRSLWILGQPRVNVVKLNLALDELN
jgi:K+-transporting ATPase ATPase C chain